jgi:hypothetical protein
MRRASQPSRQERRQASLPLALRRNQQRRTSSCLERKMASCWRLRDVAVESNLGCLPALDDGEEAGDATCVFDEATRDG